MRQKPVALILLLVLLTSAALAAMLFRGASAQTEGTPSPAVPTDAEREALLQGRLLPLPNSDYSPLLPFLLAPRNPLPAFPYQEGLLTYHSDRSGQNDVYGYHIATDETSVLVGSTSEEVTPMWSPDGQSLLFASNRDGDYDIYLRDAAGQETNLTDNPADDVHPEWAPDGSHVLFASDRDGGFFQIFRMDLASETPIRLTDVALTHLLHPRYAPDGTRIAFMRASQLLINCLWNWDIWLMNAGGTGHQKVTSHLYGDVYPDWTPDGSGITFSGCRSTFSPDFDLYTLRLSDGQLLPWLDWPDSSEWGAVYSPSGSHVAFNSDASGNNDIFYMPVGATTAAQLIENPASDLVSSWQPVLTGETFDISGDVKTDAGAAMPDVTVAVAGGPTTTTGADGSYRLEHLPPGSYQLMATKESFIFTPQTMTVTLPPDAANRHFLGTDCSSMMRNLPPLLLITGWSGSSLGGLLKDGQLHYLQEALADKGYILGCNLFYAPNTNPYENLRANGERIARYLCEIAPAIKQLNPPWDGRLDLIGYSYGGLRGRAFLENPSVYTQGGWLECDSGLDVRVRNLFTLGTPHGGELPLLPFSAFIGITALTASGGPQWPALYEMLPPVRTVQNALARQPDNVCYHIIAGDARAQVASSTSPLNYVLQQWKPAQWLPNDFAVHQASSFSLQLYGGQYENRRHAPTGDLHGQVPWMLDPLGQLRSYVSPADTFLKEIYNYLDDDQCLPPLMVPSAAQPLSRRLTASRSTTGSPPLMDIAAGPLPVGSQLTGEFTLDDTGSTQVSLYWPSGDLTFSLADPAGEPVEPTEANMGYFEMDTGFGLLASYQITDTLTGTWQYTITTGSAIPAEASYRLLALLPQSVAVQGTAPGWLPFNAPAVLTATVANSESQPLPGATVNARVQLPDGSSTLLTLHDDGVHQDTSAGDGIYGATYTGTGQSGVYGVQFQAEGTLHESHFQRTSVGYFTIASPAASLTKVYEDQALDENDDGHFEWLEVSVGVDVVEEGTYTLAAGLYDAGKIYVAHTQSQQLLVPGRHVLTLRFDGEQIHERQQDGPYTVTNLILLDERELSLLVEEVDEAHTTEAYSAASFGQPPHVFLPVVNHAKAR